MNTITDNVQNQTSLLQPSKTKANTALGQSDFLALLTAQLRNQDPLQPMQNGEFLGQMAQFSTVSGITEMQKSLEKLSQSLYSNQSFQAAGLIGHTVVAKSNQATLPSEGNLTGSMDLTSSTQTAVVNIYDAAGSLVKRLELGTQSAGKLEFTWDGNDQNGMRQPAGTYRIEAQVAVDGKMTAVDTYTSSSVNSVTLDNGKGTLVLNLKNGNILDLANVQQIL